MSLVFTALVPHGSTPVPFLDGRGSAAGAAATVSALAEVSRRFVAAEPETVVIATPHGTMVEGHVSVLDGPAVSGNTDGTPFAEGALSSFRLQFATDRNLNAAIVDAARLHGVPIVRVWHNAQWAPMDLDFGSSIPLWHLAALPGLAPRVVILCGDRGEHGIAWEEWHRLGLAVAEAAAASDRRVAFVASGDLGHCHQPDGPYGLDVASAEFDGAVVEAVRANDLGRVLTWDDDWLKRAKTDAVGPLCALAGALDGSNRKAELLSYEAPTYYGMACAVWE